MSISDLHPRPGPATVLADVLARMADELGDFDATWWANQCDDELVAEADHRELGKQRLGYGSSGGHWIRHRPRRE